MGTDAKSSGTGCFSLLRFLQRVGVEEAFCIILADCCREFVDVKDEEKGQGNKKPDEGKFIVYAADIGDR
eukprot:UN01295